MNFPHFRKSTRLFKNKILSNSMFLLTEKVIRLLISFFIIAYIARYLGPHQFGELNYAISLVGFFAILAGFGLDSLVVKELSKSLKFSQIFLGTAFYIKFIGSIILFILLVLLIQFTENNFDTKILIIIIGSSIIFQSLNVVDFYFQSYHLNQYVAISNIIQVTISSCLKLLLVYYQFSLGYIAVAYALDPLLLSILFLYFYNNQKYRNSKWKYNNKVAKILLSRSWPLILSAFAIGVYANIDQIMITKMIGTEANGIYSAAVKIVGASYFLPQVLAIVFFPLLVKRASNMNKFENSILSFYSVTIYLGLAFSVYIYIFAHFIILTVYGASYIDSVKVLQLYTFISIFVFISIVNGRWFVIKNLQKKVFYRTIIGMLINIILNYLLIPIYGINGAIYATLFSYSLGVVGSMFLFKDTRPNFIYTMRALNPKYILHFKKVIL